MSRATHLLLSLLLSMMLGAVSGCAGARVASPSTGKAGSMARFAIKDHYLYALSQHRLRVFSLERPDKPRLLIQQKVPSWMAETLFLIKDRLFVGSIDGMMIYDVSQPAKPRLMGRVRHFRSCDPVVVQGRYAFVTLRRGGRCRRGRNVLQVYDVSNSRRPRLVKSYPMQSPWGLGIDGNFLFVADGKAGLKLFDATNPLDLVHLSTHPTIQGYDVIPDQRILIVSAEDGLYQLDYRTSALRTLSRIPIGTPNRPPVKISAPLRMAPPPQPVPLPPPAKRFRPR